MTRENQIISELHPHKINILALSWRDIESPTAGGAEVNTHEIFCQLDKNLYSITHISPRYAGMASETTIDGVKYIRHGNIFTVILFAIRYYRKNRKYFDIVIDQCNTHHFFSPLWVEKTKRVFLIYQLTRDIWDICLQFPLSKVGKLLENPMLRLNKKDITITESESTKEDLVRIGFDKNKVYVIPIVMKMKPWEPSEFLKKYECPTFIFIGRHAKYKGIEDAIAALGMLRKERVHSKLIISGKRDIYYFNNVLKPLCDEWNLSCFIPQLFDSEMKGIEYEQADVIFSGFLEESIKLKTLSKSKALIFPSNREGWGIPISEAAYIGTPSIVYDNPGLRDAINYGKAGFLCKKKKPEEIKDYMEVCIFDNNEYGKVRRAAYDFSRNYLNNDVNSSFYGIVKKLI